MSETPGKVNSREGFREIIQQERLIEMALEGSRYWDLLRWKRAESVINQPARGWDFGQIESQLYYQPTLIFNQTLKKKKYLWPTQVIGRAHVLTSVTNAPYLCRHMLAKIKHISLQTT